MKWRQVYQSGHAHFRQAIGFKIELSPFQALSRLDPARAVTSGNCRDLPAFVEQHRQQESRDLIAGPGDDKLFVHRQIQDLNLIIGAIAR